ncbi:MAG: hypothetical protein IK114_03995 [Fibrobacter sp.]|nr:hypothetical protein [Fibrobacter sp.]
MAKLKTNMFLTFASLALALLALFALPTAFDRHLSVADAYLSADTEYTAPSANVPDQQSGDTYLDSNSPLRSALFLGNRRPFSQISLRPQRGGPLHRILSRDGSLFKEEKLHRVKKVSALYFQRNGFPSPLSYRVPKEYYVFTLKRILC